MEKVKKLRPNPSAKPMLDASITLCHYVLPSYKTEHLKIAQMIDKHESEQEINKALTELDNRQYDGFIERYNTLWKFAETYAGDNKIKVEKMPF